MVSDEGGTNPHGALPRQAGILIVVDHPDLQWRLARLLTVGGNRVVGTSSSGGALALVTQWPVDLVLIDEGLDGNRGLELARHIRARGLVMPMVLLTQHDEPEFRKRARIAGVTAFLTPPFNGERLLKHVRALHPLTGSLPPEARQAV